MYNYNTGPDGCKAINLEPVMKFIDRGPWLSHISSMKSENLKLKGILPYLLSICLAGISSLITACLSPESSGPIQVLLMASIGFIFHLGFIQGAAFFRKISIPLSFIILLFYELLMAFSLVQLIYAGMFNEFINLSTWLFILDDLKYFIRLISYGHVFTMIAAGFIVLTAAIILNYHLIIKNNNIKKSLYPDTLKRRLPLLLILMTAFISLQFIVYSLIQKEMIPSKTYAAGAACIFIFITGFLAPLSLKLRVTGLAPMLLLYIIFAGFTMKGKMAAPAGFEVSLSHLLFTSLHVKAKGIPDMAPDPGIHGKNMAGIAKIRPGYNLLIIINDSLRHDHFRISGYHRNTEGEMGTWFRDWFHFSRTFSTSNNTSLAAPTLFTGAGTEKGRSFLQNAPRLWDYFTADVHTFFISSESLGWKGFDRFIDTGRLDYTWDSVRGKYGMHGRFDDSAAFERLLEHIAGIKGTFAGIWHNSYAHYPYESEKKSKRYLPESVDRNSRDQFINRYDNSLVHLSEKISRLFTFMKSSGLYDRTVIIFTSDHGESLGEKGIYYHGKSLYPGEIRVPLLIHIPEGLLGSLTKNELDNFRANRDRITSTIDILPTVLHLLDRNREKRNTHFTGMSFGKSLFNEHEPGRMVLSSECIYGYVCLSSSYAFINNDMYYMINRSDDGWNRRLYLHSKDPGLTHEVKEKDIIDRAEEEIKTGFPGLSKGFR